MKTALKTVLMRKPELGTHFHPTWPTNGTVGPERPLSGYRGEEEDTMGILLVVDFMSVLVFGLLVVSVVTPSGSDSRRARTY